MIIETTTVNTANSQDAVYTFLADLNNLEQLMPEGKIENWKSDVDSCQFGIKGMATIGLKVIDRKQTNEINIESFGKAPFKFKLNIHIEEVDANNAQAKMIFDGDVNPFMKMMVEKPLTNFFNMLTAKVGELKL
ncbi:hypothetical protein OAB47_02215 [Vicingaceae bacterium]|nr:hypothetical protein [Vicingaceae bacterium]